MNVNFILTNNSGVLHPEERRAIVSARIHGSPIVLWYIENAPDISGLDIQLEYLELPSWVPPTYRAQIFDLCAYQVMHEHGGMILQLDTISIRSAWDLLTTQDIVVGTDWPPTPVGDVQGNATNLKEPYQVMFVAKPGTTIAAEMYLEAQRRILSGTEPWGHTGPCMLTQFVRDNPGLMTGAPFPALCGWAPGYIWRFYLGLEAPPPGTRVIHLFRTAYRALYDRRYDDWARENPAYADCVARRTGINDHLLLTPDC